MTQINHPTFFFWRVPVYVPPTFDTQDRVISDLHRPFRGQVPRGRRRMPMTGSMRRTNEEGKEEEEEEQQQQQRKYHDPWKTFYPPLPSPNRLLTPNSDSRQHVGLRERWVGSHIITNQSFLRETVSFKILHYS